MITIPSCVPEPRDVQAMTHPLAAYLLLGGDQERLSLIRTMQAPELESDSSSQSLQAGICLAATLLLGGTEASVHHRHHQIQNHRITTVLGPQYEPKS
jgi:hypothetical protein